MLKGFVFNSRKWNHLQVFIFLLLFFAIGYLVVHPKLVLRWIPITNETKVLKPIAATLRTKGDVRRKLANDLLWLPVEDNIQLYYGDSIFSSTGASVEIIFSEKQSVVLRENCLVRIGLFQDKPLIELITGEFNVQVKEPEIVYVRDAQNINPKEAVAGAEEQVVSSRKSADQTTSIPVASEEGKEPEAVADGLKPATPAAEQKVTHDKAVFKPFPAEATVFLHFGSGKVRVSSESPCVGDCEISVVSNQVNLKKEFNKGEIPQLQIHVSAGMSEQIQWSLKDSGQTFQSQFEIRPYNETFFKKAISEKRIIEVISE